MKIKLTKEQKDFLNRYAEGIWKLNTKTGLVDINGDLYCQGIWLDKKDKNKNLKGIRFGVVKGDFTCAHNNLTSLEGAPQKVEGNFNCSCNKLTSLEGAPKEVKGDFNCSYNNLTSLEGVPKVIGGVFEADCNPIPKKILKMICYTMNRGIPYDIALASLKKVLQEEREKEILSREKAIQKIVSSYNSFLSQIEDEVAKGASALGKFGII